MSYMTSQHCTCVGHVILYYKRPANASVGGSGLLFIHSSGSTPVVVICHAYPERLPDRGRDWKKDCFYHGLHPYLHDALSFTMAELPEREQACPMFDTLYTLAKKLEAGQLACTCQYTPSSDVYREQHRCYPVPSEDGSPGRGRAGVD